MRPVKPVGFPANTPKNLSNPDLIGVDYLSNCFNNCFGVIILKSATSLRLNKS